MTTTALLALLLAFLLAGPSVFAIIDPQGTTGHPQSEDALFFFFLNYFPPVGQVHLSTGTCGLMKTTMWPVGHTRYIPANPTK
jgi:hypothetical protein